MPDGACAAGVFAGVGLDAVPLDCAQTPAANASANPDRTASLKPMRSVALMTSPPRTVGARAHLPRFALCLRRKYLLFWHQWEAGFLPQASGRPRFSARNRRPPFFRIDPPLFFGSSGSVSNCFERARVHSCRKCHKTNAGLYRLRKNPSFLFCFFPGEELSAFSARFALVSWFRFAPAGHVSGIQAHFGPSGPALQSQSVSACAPGYAPRWSAGRTSPPDPVRAASPDATPGPASTSRRPARSACACAD